MRSRILYIKNQLQVTITLVSKIIDMDDPNENFGNIRGSAVG